MSSAKGQMKSIIIAVMILCFIGAAGFLVIKKKQQLSTATMNSKRPVPVRMATVERGSLIQGYSYLSEVESCRVSHISSRLTSQITRILAAEGDQVRKGQLLIQLESRELKSAVDQARAQLSESHEQAAALQATLESQKKNLDFWRQEEQRNTFLAGEGALARSEADATVDRLHEVEGRLKSTEHSLRAMKEQINVAEKRLDQAVIKLSYTNLTAPFDGVVRKRMADPGDLALTGVKLLEIEDGTCSKLVFTIPQEEALSIRQGLSVKVKGFETDAHLHISRVHPALNQDRTLTVEIDLPSDLSIRAGSYILVDVVLEKFDDVLLVPEDCLISTPQGKKAVFIVENGVTRPIFVKLLAVKDEMAAIAGLPVGTHVVRTTFLGWNRLSAGEFVEVMQ
ncbi:MAG: efflux RND transporter periplasmic adaptor subunit [Desulfuromonadales bacterium]|nr:efflux RND transporter periplasmic adaptor subunit [Desulfuromonadales bacterium]MBN2790914.1 efflux RND transporter periplasmic adaptor subunit [Desulfuromonadales bacterium]